MDIDSLEMTGDIYQVRLGDPNGFGVQVNRTGGKTFFYRGSVHGRRVYKSLGAWPEVSVEEARSAASALIEAEDMISSRVPTVAAAFGEYKNVRSRKLKPASRRNIELALSTIDNISGKTIDKVTPQDVVGLHREIGERSESQANASLRWLRAVWNYSAEVYDIPGRNPVDRLSKLRLWYPTKRKTSTLPDCHVHAWLTAVRKEQVGPVLEFLLFTGLRLREAEGLQWSDIDLAQKVFTVRNTKNGKPHRLPLTDHLVSLCHSQVVPNPASSNMNSRNSRNNMTPNGGDVFYTTNLRRRLVAVNKQLGIHVTAHDLRRTFATVSQRVGVPGYTLKLLLNHSTGSDVTAGYVVADVEMFREPMQKIGDYLLSLR